MARCDHVMLDKETLNVTPDGVILSIGAVRFDLDSDEIDDAGFYASISIDSNMAAGRTISESTLIWWLGQSPEAQAVFHEAKMSLEPALVDFVQWFGDAKYIWSNGADFDIPMMAHALRSFGMDTPWDFWNARCVRTMKNLPGCKDIKVANPVKHNALQDAIAQAKLVQAIQKKLKGNHPMVKA
jgi:DNA polymerase III epsilon subunit-like protein